VVGGEVSQQPALMPRYLIHKLHNGLQTVTQKPDSILLSSKINE